MVGSGSDPRHHRVKPGASSRRRLAYLLVLLPTVTEYLEQGRFPSSWREVITDTLVTIALFILVWRQQRDYLRIFQLSQTDPLTGLGNRRKLQTDLAIEIARARRSHLPLSLAFLDLDRFKSINDRYGHDRGDTVLAEIGTLLRQTTRASGDRWYRVGGDEFIVLLPEADHRGARQVLTRTSGIIMRVLAPYQAGLSMGVTQLEARDSAQDLLERADRHLYTDKSA